jgi:hypothetical protein
MLRVHEWRKEMRLRPECGLDAAFLRCESGRYCTFKVMVDECARFPETALTLTV